MKMRLSKSISTILAVLMLASIMTFSAAAHIANPDPPSPGLTISTDRAAVAYGETIDIYVDFLLFSGHIYPVDATQVAVLLPAGLEHLSTVAYVEGAPMVVTTVPVQVPAGTSVVVGFNNYNYAGAGRVIVSARVTAAVNTSININAGIYLQPRGGEMPSAANEQRTVAIQVIGAEIPQPPPIPPQPPDYGVVRVVFDLAGGQRVGGGALLQSVPVGGSAVEPYVHRLGYVFLGWDGDFYNVQNDITIRATWISDSDLGAIPIVPPIYEFVTGHFLGGRNTFTQYSHMPLIYYADRHVAHFVSVIIDGQTLNHGVHFIATAGQTASTTAIHLKASFLNTLAVGSRSLQINFRDYEYVNDSFTIVRYANPFTDVSSADWFYRGVEAMFASELLLGINATQFGPYYNMTRGMVVTLLYRYAGEPSVIGFRNPFPDVAANQYYTNAVIWAAANGIVTGHENGMFAPDDLMTREQFAAVLYRYQNALGSLTADILVGFQYSDYNSIALFARAAVNKLTTQGVFRDWPSDPQGRFLPTATVNRAEVATVMRYWIESTGW